MDSSYPVRRDSADIFIISGFGIYHSWRFGFRTPMVQSVTAAYLAGAAIILILTIVGIISLDWSQVWEIGREASL